MESPCAHTIKETITHFKNCFTSSFHCFVVEATVLFLFYFFYQFAKLCFYLRLQWSRKSHKNNVFMPFVTSLRADVVCISTHKWTTQKQEIMKFSLKFIDRLGIQMWEDWGEATWILPNMIPWKQLKCLFQFTDVLHWACLLFLARVVYVCVFMFVHSPLHASDPSLHASCAVTTRTPSILQTRNSPSHPLTPPRTPPLHPYRGQQRGPKTPSPFRVSLWLHRATGLERSEARWEWRGQWVMGAAWLGSPAAR